MPLFQAPQVDNIPGLPGEVRRISSPSWSAITRGNALTLRLLGNADSHHDPLKALEPGVTICFILGAGEPVAESTPVSFLALTLHDGDDVRESVSGGVLLRFKKATVTRLASTLEKRQRLDLDLPDKSALRLRWVSNKVDEQSPERSNRCPKRDPVPLPEPNFSATGSWASYTSPFQRVYSSKKK
jgi:hypothetical protein